MTYFFRTKLIWGEWVINPPVSDKSWRQSVAHNDEVQEVNTNEIQISYNAMLNRFFSSATNNERQFFLSRTSSWLWRWLHDFSSNDERNGNNVKKINEWSPKLKPEISGLVWSQVLV